MTAQLQHALVNGRYLTRPPTGVDRFAIELLASLARRQGKAVASRAPAPFRPLHIAVPSGTALRDPRATTGHPLNAVGRRQGNAWEQFELPGAAGDRPLINLCNTAPLWRERQLVVIHDLGIVANAGNYSRAFRAWYRVMHGAVMRRARVVATVSRFSADALANHHGRRRRGIEVIHEGGEHILAQPADERIIERLALEGRRYVLAVGSRSPNKNFDAVLQAVQLQNDPDLLLVAAGGSNAKIYRHAHAIGPQVKTAGYVSDGELRALYENAACFAFPSFYEGFGLPPLEAMCCGCPVIVSDRASLPEVCGDAAIYCKAEDPQTLADALRRLLASPAAQRERREAGLDHATRFSWDRAARHFEQVVDAAFA